MQVRSPEREDPLEYEIAIGSSILAWEIPWTEEPGGLHSMEPQSQTQLSKFFSKVIHVILYGLNFGMSSFHLPYTKEQCKNMGILNFFF